MVDVNTSLGNRYVLHDVLGRGAMGEVFRGSVREFGAPVAVKVLRAKLVAASRS
jgi:serine/threonine protein kinase